MSPAPLTIFTLGHSRHPIGRFLDLLECHGVRRVVDTRGTPFSRFNPQFNRERLRTAMTDAGIDYQWRGETLSGRPRDRQFYGPDGKVLWDRLAAWPELHTALDEVAVEAAAIPTALICAEENPLRCHRRFLLTPPLMARGGTVLHIRGDGTLQRDEDVGRPLSGGAQLDLFG